jgi:hypothetical protein
MSVAPRSMPARLQIVTGYPIGFAGLSRPAGSIDSDIPGAFPADDPPPDYSWERPRSSMDSVIADGHLLIASMRNAPEMYDLLVDPKNQRNLAGRPENHPRQEHLKRELDILRGQPIRDSR